MSGKLEGQILLLAGPTASGKSDLALRAAERLDAEIVNADSMQVYADLRVLTARPSAEEAARTPHHLFGHVDAAETYSVGRWLKDAQAALEDIARRGRSAIVVGGTGLYFKALIEGLAEVAEPGEAARAYAADVLERGGLAGLGERARELDPAGAATVSENDASRLLRLVAVARGLGRPLSELRKQTAPPALSAPWRPLVLEPERAELYARIGARAAQMVEAGATEEAVRLVARGIAPDRPVMKALGVSLLAQMAAGEIGEAEALEALARDTRRYAKRQLTWFRNQTPDWPRIAAPDVAAAIEAWCGQPPR